MPYPTPDFFACYDLISLDGENRKGFLFAHPFPNGLWGIADYCPWTHLGDPPLSEALPCFLEKTPFQHPLMQRAFLLATTAPCWDPQQGKLLGEPLKSFPKTHLFLTVPDLPSLLQKTDILRKRGLAKWKVTPLHTPVLQELLPTLLKKYPLLTLRLDFNTCYENESSFLQDWKTWLQTWYHRIDFLEDPFPFDAATWSKAQKTCSVTFAFDRPLPLKGTAPVSKDWEVLLVKPALSQTPARIADKRCILTSYLGHPLELWHSLQIWQEAQLRHPQLSLETHGLSEHYDLSQENSLQIKMLDLSTRWQQWESPQHWYNFSDRLEENLKKIPWKPLQKSV